MGNFKDQREFVYGEDELDFDDDPKNIIFEYIKDRRNNRKGLLITGIVDGEVCFGWSLCNTTQDKFNRGDAFGIAVDRLYCNDRYMKYAQNGGVFDHFEFMSDILPASIRKNGGHFADRIKRYYKNEKFSEITAIFVNTY